MVARPLSGEGSDCVEAGFCSDPLMVANAARAGLADRDLEVFPDLAAAGFAADPVPDFRLPFQGSVGHGGDTLEPHLGRDMEVLALGAALSARTRVEADHQLLAGEVGTPDLGLRVGDRRVGASAGWSGFPSPGFLADALASFLRSAASRAASARVRMLPDVRLSCVLRGPGDPRMAGSFCRSGVASRSLILDAEPLKVLGAIVPRRIRYYNRVRRHSFLGGRPHLGILGIAEGGGGGDQ